ncbi:ceramidase [Auricularia subglabra TFB-10046 SS5]|nr:ceramidase [Auricularia subglabra TFB-10046 SS5]
MFAVSSSLLAAASLLGAVHAQYLTGLGIGDITGPIVETNMMGYAALDQTDTGLHMRQRARAFIVADAANPSERVLFVNLDIGMGDTGIRRGILAKLQNLYNGTYTGQNTALSSTHSHAGVGGYVENLLPQLTSLGFVPQAYNAIVDGTIKAIQRAHDSLKPGSLAVGSTVVQDGNINRSPFAYLQNPAEERARYTDDQDKDLSLLNFLGQDGKSRGFLSFYPVHGTSLYGNNTLVSGDNKGMAAFLYESFVEPNAAPGATTFVAGFAQANVGDTSPNVLGAFCESPGQPWDGQPCDFRTSTCGNKTQDCHGRGPGYLISDFESNRIIGDRQFQGAKKLVTGNSLKPVQGIVRSIHQYIDMTNYTFALANGSTVHTCPAAMGYSFAGGTTDGPGAFDFTQGNNNTSQNPLWEIVKGAVTPAPSQAQIACHAPKPILFNTGMATFPYNWTPHVVDVQILRIGNFVILVMPGEFTTMAGRRIREAIRAKLIKEGAIGDDAYVVIAGPANTYSHYITTREEYAVQRYEGASTIYGPFTHEAYMDIYAKLTPYLGQNVPANPPPNAPAPPDLTKSPLSLQTGVVMDGPPSGKKFGDPLVDVAGKTFKAGDTVSVTFVGANPRNNLHLEGTYLSVDKLVSGTNFTTVRTDGHPSTRFQWLRTGGGLSATSEVTITWTIESGTPAGQYRVSYFGDSKPFIGSISPFTGRSGTFTVA